jgi:hypothetical protein
MKQNIVFGVGSEIARIDGSGLTISNTKSLTVNKINIPLTTTTATMTGPLGSSASLSYQVTGNVVTLSIASFGQTTTFSDFVDITLPSEIVSARTKMERGIYLYYDYSYKSGMWYGYQDTGGNTHLVLCAGLSYTPFPSGSACSVPQFTISYIL